MKEERKTYRHSHSFADKLRAGWTKEQLMQHFHIDEEKYERILASLKQLRVHS